MSSLSQIIESAKSKNATGLLIHPGASPRIRLGQEWQPTDLAPISADQSQQLFASWLSAEEKKAVQENKIIEGIKTLGQIQFQFSFFLDTEGIKGSLYWKDVRATNNDWWAFPELVVETLSRPQGLVLVCGLRRAGKTSAMQSLLSSWGKKAKKSVLVISDFEDWNLNDSSILVSRLPSSVFLKQDRPPAESDVVIIDSRHSEFAEKALRWSEDGRLVILSMTSSSLRTGLDRFLFQNEGLQEKNWKRIAEQFKMGIGLRLVPGTESAMIGAYELALSSPEITEAIHSGQLDRFEQSMRNSQDKVLMRSLNQSLFQLVVKRQIEFRIAFENSNDPTELDQLFRKVGI